MESYHGDRSIIFGMRNSCQGKQHPRSRTGVFISALLSGNQSQFNFETLIATETNYKRQDLKPLIKVGVGKATRPHHRGNAGRTRDWSTGAFSLPGNYRSKTRQGSTSPGSGGNPVLGPKASGSGE